MFVPNSFSCDCVTDQSMSFDIGVSENNTNNPPVIIGNDGSVIDNERLSYPELPVATLSPNKNNKGIFIPHPSSKNVNIFEDS